MRITTTFVFAFALGSASFFAQGLQTTFPHGGKVDLVGTTAAPPALQKIFSNLTTSTTAAYSNSGYDVAGALSALGSLQYIGLPFTSSAAAHVEELAAAVQYISGANQVELAVYSNVSGAPGVLLAGPVTVTNLPTYPACCTLAAGTLKTPLAIAAGTVYWLVASSPKTGTGSDFEGVWNWVSPQTLPAAYYLGSGWLTAPATIEQSAGAVYGTIP